MFTIESVLDDLCPQRNTPGWQKSLLRILLREKEFQQFNQKYRHLKGLDMAEQVLDYFDIRCELSERDLEQIPSQGPVVIVANHPLGTLISSTPSYANRAACSLSILAATRTSITALMAWWWWT